MNKYLKYFETEQEYISYMQGSEVLRPNISFCEGTDDVHFNKPNIEITVRSTSTAPQSGYDYGDVLSLAVTITNTGDENVTAITVVSEMTGDEWSIESLAPGGSKSFEASYTVISDEIVKGEINIDFKATGKVSNNQTTTTECLFIDDNVAQPNPSFYFSTQVTSTPTSNSEYKLGDTITYSVTVVNDGNVNLNKVTFNNQFTLNANIIPEYRDTLQGLTYTVTETDILAGSVSDYVNAIGLFPSRSAIYTTVTESNKLTVNNIEEPNPSLAVQARTTSLPLDHKTGKYALAEIISYLYTVTNDGNLTIKHIDVESELTGDLWTINSLAPGQSKVFPTEYTVTEADVLAGSVTNVATANGDNDSDDPTDPGVGETVDMVEEPNPHLTLYKIATSTPANRQYYVLDETIEYKVTVINDGNLTITDITVTDEMTGDEWSIDSLAHGAAMEFETSYVVTEADVLAGSVTNVATANGDNDSDDPTVVVDGVITSPVG